MRAYCITYDLKVPSRNYSGLYEAMKAIGKWWHYLDSTWIVVSEESSQGIWNRLYNHIDKNDYLLIIEVKGNPHGWLPKDAWDWIRENVPRN